MADSVVYDNIFEAIRFLKPNDIILDVLNGRKGGIIRKQNYTAMQLQNGKYGFFLENPEIRYYRGENTLYGKCIPSLYRVPEGANRIIEEIKTLDFMFFLENHPEIQERIKQNENIDIKAIAQHYGFATDMLDLTSDLHTACFFATHQYDSERNLYSPQESGFGRIRTYYGFGEPVGKIRMIGLQPFARPGLQSAYGLVMSENEDFSSMSGSVVFKQDLKMNQLFDSVFLQGVEMYFPNEYIVDFLSKIIKNNTVVTSMSIEKYTSKHNVDYKDIEKLLVSEGITIVDAPLICYNMPIRG